MSSLTFSDFTELCELNLEKQYVREIYDTIINSDCIYFPGGILPQENMASLYELRLSIDKEEGNKDAVYINDYEKAVSNLNQSRSTVLGLIWLISNLYSYLIFYELSPPIILGVLKKNVSKSLQSFDEDFTAREKQGYTSGFQKYSKGELVKAWK